jgi:hypothetical protein
MYPFPFPNWQLVSFKWKLAVAMRSNTAKNLNRAYVAVEMVVADAAAKPATHAFELTISEFQVLRPDNPCGTTFIFWLYYMYCFLSVSL